MKRRKKKKGAETYIERNQIEKFSTLNVRKIYPLVLLAMLRYRQGKTLETEENNVIRTWPFE
jgi:hypothetical protein